MLTANSHENQESDFDPIALETKIEADFQKAQAEQEFCNSYIDDPRTTFEDGLWDGYLNFEPEPYQWTSLPYKTGYLDGVAKKLDEYFAC